MSKKANDGWIGVDLDGTLAVYDQWRGSNHVGEPIPAMVERVKKWIAEGRNVRIFTARISKPENNALRQRDAAFATIAIQDWCLEVFGQMLPITNVKDYSMYEFWDDRAIQVVKNTGIRIGDIERG